MADQSRSLIVELGAENSEFKRKIEEAKIKLNDYAAAAEKAAARSQALDSKFEQIAKTHKAGSPAYETAFTNMNKAGTSAQVAALKVEQAKESLVNLEHKAVTASQATGGLGNMFDGMQTKLIGLASGIAIGEIAFETIKGSILSTQVTGDEYRAMMGGAKESTEALFKTLATGDFTNLITNMEKAFKTGEKYVRVMDEIGDVKRSWDIQKVALKAEQNELMLTARSQSNSVDVRKKAIADLKKSYEFEYQQEKKISDRSLKASLDVAAEKTGLSTETITKLISNYDKYTTTLTDGAKLEKQLLAASMETTSMMVGDELVRSSAVNMQKYTAELAKLTPVQQLSVKLSKGFNLLTDEETNGRIQLTGEIIAQKNALVQHSNNLKSLVRLENGLNSKVKEETESKGYLGSIDKKITDLQKQKLASDFKEIAGIDLKIKALEEEKLSINELGLTLDDFYKKYGKGTSVKTIVEFENKMKTGGYKYDFPKPDLTGSTGGDEGEAYAKIMDEVEAGYYNHWKRLNDIQKEGQKEQAQNDKDAADAASALIQQREQEAQSINSAIGAGYQDLGNSIVQSMGLASDGMEGFLAVMASGALRLIAMELAKATASAIMGGAAAGAASGPLAPITTPVFIGEMVGIVASAFAAIPSFATGGEVFGPTLAMIGDNPGRREMIIPSEKYHQLMNGTGNNQTKLDVVLSGQISGRDIRLANKYGQQRYSIVTGRK